jgi:uncharacterized protein YndB with AHSA1/START domain
VTEPLRLSFFVACPPGHAFDVWTRQISRWWPADHTATGAAGSEVVLEGRPGGRILERTAAGEEIDWGEVSIWEPPRRLVYWWHLRRDRADATEVEIAFRDSPGGTLVEIEHRGWERLGAAGPDWRQANQGGWATLLPHYVAVIGVAAP